MRGSVATEDERRFVRALLRRQGGIFAVWDLLALPDQRLAVADIGCGGQKQIPDAVGVDRVPGPHVDVVADLEERLPWRPLMVSAAEDTIFADMLPIKDGATAERAEIARWFY
jgi:hypothetical protein